MPVNEDGTQRYSRHGQLVGDWTSLFAPVVFEPHRRWSWPIEGSIVLDHLGFRIRELRPDGTPKTAPVAFNVLAALGYENGAPFLWKLAASPTVGRADWRAFLSGLDGTPRRVVTDGHDGTIGAAIELWPDADHWRSEWHLRAAFYDELVACKQHGDTRLHRALKQAFINRNFWESFAVVAHRFGSDKLNRLVDRHGPLILDQFRGRPDASRARINPLTTGGLEPRLERLKAWLAPRSHSLLNRQRLDCLLMLMQLHLNGQASEAAYTHAIRDWLTVNGGRPNRDRRWAAEPAGAASLRSPRARR
jgi:hypothetical protein